MDELDKLVAAFEADAARAGAPAGPDPRFAPGSRTGVPLQTAVTAAVAAAHGPPDQTVFKQATRTSVTAIRPRVHTRASDNLDNSYTQSQGGKNGWEQPEEEPVVSSRWSILDADLQELVAPRRTSEPKVETADNVEPAADNGEIDTIIDAFSEEPSPAVAESQQTVSPAPTPLLVSRPAAQLTVHATNPLYAAPAAQTPKSAPPRSPFEKPRLPAVRATAIVESESAPPAQTPQRTADAPQGAFTTYAAAQQAPQGNQCPKCHDPIDAQTVIALNHKWHPEHFQCDECQLVIANLTFFERDYKVLCVDCFEQKYVYTCVFCREPIKGPFITAMQKTFHPHHFFCSQCGQQFPTGQSFMERDGLPYCGDCFSSLFATRCAKCDQCIDGEFFQTQNKQFHQQCFTCETCNCAFKDGSYFVHDGRPYCEQHYYEARDMLCHGCNRPVMGRCLLLSASTRYHFECFRCALCSADLRSGATAAAYSGTPSSSGAMRAGDDASAGSGGFHEVNGRPYCLHCAATRLP